MSKPSSRGAFFVGSWVGLAQAYVGMGVAMRFGPVAALFASFAVYVLLYNIYVWATKIAEGDNDERG